MTLKERITEDMKSAMRAKDSPRLTTIRMLLAALKQREVDERIVLDDAAVIAIAEKMIKQRRESIEQFERGGRADLAQQEKFELGVLAAYLPQQMDDAELAAAVAAAVAAVVADQGAAGPRDMGKVMASLKAAIAGRADMARASALVKAKLAG